MLNNIIKYYILIEFSKYFKMKIYFSFFIILLFILFLICRPQHSEILTKTQGPPNVCEKLYYFAFCMHVTTDQITA